jgi:hypothetical protein
MSRQKSNRALLIEQERTARMEERKRKREEKERDRGIREERRQQKAAEKQAKREERLKRQLVHESIERNGVPKVQSGGMQLGIRDAIAYSPLVDCDRCHTLVRELIGGLCERCHYSNEGRTNDGMTETEQGDRAVPGKGDGGNGTTALAGQLMLIKL